MKIDRFEDIIAWQKAQNLAVSIYNLFKSSKDFGFRDQIQRATVSISNNIAEGFERRGDKEFKHFLYVAKGSCGEVRSMLYLCVQTKQLTDDEAQALSQQTEEISKILSGLISKLN